MEMKQVTKTTFKKLCKSCFESNNCKECVLKNIGCGQVFRKFLQDHIIKIEDEVDNILTAIEAIDKNYCLPSDFINKNTGNFMFSEELGELKLETEIEYEN